MTITPGGETWNIVSNQYHISYHLTKNINICYQEEKLYEYGIECTLFDSNGNLISFNQLNCISPDYDKVFELVQILKKFEVFPVHLKDIVSDMLYLTAEEVTQILYS